MILIRIQFNTIIIKLICKQINLQIIEMQSSIIKLILILNLLKIQYKKKIIMKNWITKRLIKINSKLRITYLKKSFLMDII